MHIISSTNPISCRDMEAIKRMHKRSLKMTQTRCRRIKIWKALGDPNAIDAMVVWTRTYRSGITKRVVNILKISVA